MKKGISPLLIKQLIWLGVGLWSLNGVCHAQTRTDSTRAEEVIFVEYDIQPIFPGGHKALTAYLQKHIRYPKTAANAGITGRVFVSFIIDTAGYISDITILKGLGYGCDEEAIRVVKQMPAPWTPGTHSGKPWRVRYNLPITFPPT
jgi:protein TonB